jgi:hypothetical protein
MTKISISKKIDLLYYFAKIVILPKRHILNVGLVYNGENMTLIIIILIKNLTLQNTLKI